MYKYLFGPVNSRRLGISLGVDLVPYKVCNLNCVYCESGKTTLKTNERKEYIPAGQIIEEIDLFLSSQPNLDYITFSGAGEPLLNSGFKNIVEHLKSNYPFYKLALITNGTLLSSSEIRKEILPIDLLLPSLDAVFHDSFNKVNRPHKSLNIEEIIEGLVELKNDFKGYIWLEYFIVPGVNDSLDEILAAKKIFEKIRPHRIQLNSLDRPGTEDWVQQLDESNLYRIQELLYPLKTEILSRNYLKSISGLQREHVDDIILETIKRRPSSFNDLILATNTPDSLLSELLKKLMLEKKICSECINGEEFYKLIQ